MAKKENKFIVAAHDLQTLAAVPRIKYTATQTTEKKREAITLKEEKKITAKEKKGKINIIYLCVCTRRERERASRECVRAGLAHACVCTLLIWLRKNGVI